MTPSLGGVFADAGSLWRKERTLLLPVAGVFFVLPMLASVLLLAGAHFGGQDATPEQLSEALQAFYQANLPVIFLLNVTIAFGTFVVLNLFLQGGGRTLGEVLRTAAIRFLPYFAMHLIASFAFGLGLSLFVLPGLFVFARTWLAGPAYAAQPQRGIGAAFRAGWRQSGGVAWLLILGAAASAFFATVLAILLFSVVLGLLAALAGGSEVVVAIGYLFIAAIGGLTWTALAVLRVAFYRATLPRQGI